MVLKSSLTTVFHTRQRPQAVRRRSPEPPCHPAGLPQHLGAFSRGRGSDVTSRLGGAHPEGPCLWLQPGLPTASHLSHTADSFTGTLIAGSKKPRDPLCLTRPYHRLRTCKLVMGIRAQMCHQGKGNVPSGQGLGGPPGGWPGIPGGTPEGPGGGMLGPPIPTHRATKQEGKVSCVYTCTHSPGSRAHEGHTQQAPLCGQGGLEEARRTAFNRQQPCRPESPEWGVWAIPRGGEAQVCPSLLPTHQSVR